MPDKPNILLIITDHEAYYGHNRPGEFDYAWPRYDRFCSQGTRFDRAYSVCPLCTPARASMMCGRYPSSHGLTLKPQQCDKEDFASGDLLYSHYLTQAGYRNAYVGKWHAGVDRIPIDFGIEGWSEPDYGHPYASDRYWSYASDRGIAETFATVERHVRFPEWKNERVNLRQHPLWHYMSSYGVLDGPPDAHELNFVANLAIEKLGELTKDSQPWSLVASFWGPHQPFLPSEPFASMVNPASIPQYPSFEDDLQGRPLRHVLDRELHSRGTQQWRDWSIWQQALSRVYGQGYQTDAAVGMVLDELDRLGVAEDTIVVWTADHGDAIASHGRMWDKGTSFIEEVMRVRFAVRWPDRLPAGQQTSSLVSNMDVTATVLDAAGISIPDEMDSRSVLDLCEDPALAGTNWPQHLICEHHGHDYQMNERVVITDRHKYGYALFDGDELYDTREDPFEMNNLASSGEHAEIRHDMRRILLDHLQGTTNREARRLVAALENGR